MTTATRRALDPPGSRAQGCDSREGDTVEDERAPARALLLTMQSVSRTHPELLARLTDSFFDLRTLARWEQFLSEVDRLPGGLVLLDLDEAERSPSLRELRL